MLFHLFFLLKDSFGPLNVFRYPSFRVLVAMATALVITWTLYPWFIRLLQQKQIGQVIREEMDDAHQKKKNTPTMGGILLILAVAITTLLWADLSNPLVWCALGVTVLFAVIGFIDDAMKLGVRGSSGLSERGKLVGQFLVSGAAVALLLWGTDQGMSTTLHLPFVAPERYTLVLPPVLYLFFTMFVITGASNAVNLTDGLDGLAVGPVIIAALTFGLLAYVSATEFTTIVRVDDRVVVGSFDVASYLKIPKVPGAHELSVFCAAVIGAGFGFLWYNAHPAKVFMGDVGSLGLGGALGSVAVLTRNELLCAIVMGLFVVEALSVLIQRYYFRFTGGRRIFLRAPLHHHFERLGWSETQIVVRFWIIAILLSGLALASLKLR